MLAACSVSEPIIEEEIVRDLRLSVTETVSTEDICYEFEIVDGNEPYTATVSETDGDPDGVVTIEGNVVKVDILHGYHCGPTVTITDGKGQQKSVGITSYSEALNMTKYGMHLDPGTTHPMDIKFGAGAPYTIEKIRGHAHDARIEGDRVVATSFGLGDTYYKLRDRRGSVTRFEINTVLIREIDRATKYLDITGVNTMTATIRIPWDSGWKITGSTCNAVEKVSVYPFPGYYVLFVGTSDEGRGDDIITLRSWEGDEAVVRVRVK